MIKLLVWMSLCVLVSHNPTWAAEVERIPRSVGTIKQAAAEPAEEFIEDLREFVRSLKSEKYRSGTYWHEVDKLWEALQLRKDQLDQNLTSEQRQKIRKWERKYRNLKRKRNRTT